MKRKHFLTLIAVITFFANILLINNSYSQELNFTETVKYINDKFHTTTEDMRNELKVNIYGDCELRVLYYGETIRTFSFNLNDISTVLYYFSSGSYCIEFICSSGNCIGFSSSGLWPGCIRYGFSETNAKALAGAFLHLKELIKPNPF